MLNEPSSAQAGARRKHLAPQIPDHELLRVVGEGSYGEVWLARNVMGTYRAVKVVYRDSFDHARPFEREFTGIQKFEPVSRLHDGLVDILQVGRNDEAGYFYYVMELADPFEAEGEKVGKWESGGFPPAHSPTFSPAKYRPRTLASEIGERGRLPCEECLPLFLSLTSALGHLHQNGLIHRDIKPSNIIFVNGVAKLADIGLVAEPGESTSYVGTEGYIPPEGPGTRQADLYSLGKLFYEMATGQDRTKFPTLPVELGDLDASKGLLELNAVLVKACANDTQHRYRSAEEMHADLALLQSGKSVKRLHAIERRLAQATRLGAVIAVLLALALGAYLFSEHQRHVVQDNYERAEAQRRRAERAEAAAREEKQGAVDNLWSASLAQARAGRRSGRAGQRLESLEAVKRAVAIRPALELRNEAIAALALTDLRALKPGGDLVPGKQFVAFDDALERFVKVTDDRQVSVCSVDDGATLIKLPGGISPSNLGSAFSPNGQWLVLYHLQGHLIVWSLERREIVLQAPADGSLVVCDFSPDNRSLITGHRSGRLVFRDVNTGATNQTFVTGVTPDFVRFNGDGEKLTVCSRSARRIEVRAAQGGRLLLELVHPDIALAAAWSPDSRWLATGCYDGSVYIWDAATGQQRQVLSGHRGAVNALAFLDSEGMLASLSWDGTTRLWNRRTGRALVTVFGSGYACGFNPRTGRLGWRTFHESQLELFEVVPATVLRVFPGSTNQPTAGLNFVDFSPEERWLVTGAKDGVRLWDLSTGQLTAQLPMNMAHTILFSPSGDSFVTCAWSGLERWPIVQVADDELTIGPPQPFTPALTSPRMFVRASHAGDDVFTTIHRGPIQGYRSGTNFITLAGSERTTSIAASPDGKWIAAGYWGSSGVRLWDAQTGKFIRDFPTFQRALVAFTPDSRWLAVGAVDEYCFWDVATGARGMRIPRVQAGAIWGPMAFSRDGQLMALASSRWLVQLREVRTGHELASLEYPDTATISWLAFSPSGTQLAVATDVVHVWDLRRLRQELAALKLDWDQSAFPPPNPTSGANPRRVKILSASRKAKP